jgi:hypothetical protein
LVLSTILDSLLKARGGRETGVNCSAGDSGEWRVIEPIEVDDEDDQD